MNTVFLTCVLFFLLSLSYSSLVDPCPRARITNTLSNCETQKCWVNCEELLKEKVVKSSKYKLKKGMKDVFVELYVPAQLCKQVCGKDLQNKNKCSCIKFAKYYHYTNAEMERLKQQLVSRCLSKMNTVTRVIKSIGKGIKKIGRGIRRLIRRI